MDATQLYSSTLEQLNRTIVKMTSAEWDAKIHAAAPADRQRALAELLRVQHARLVLGNAALQAIAEALKDNEQTLVRGQAKVQAALDTLATVKSVLNAVSAFVTVVAQVVPLL